jgi:hypothetical protein
VLVHHILQRGVVGQHRIHEVAVAGGVGDRRQDLGAGVGQRLGLLGVRL